jgi:hypothetical protein
MSTALATMDRTSGSEIPPHPILACLAAIDDALNTVTHTAAWTMTADEQRTALVAGQRTEARLGELRLRVLAAAEVNQIGDASGATSTPAWVAHHTRQTRRDAHADLRLATSLDPDHETTRAALAAGVVNHDQAKVIVWALSLLGDDVPANLRVEAERWLVREAASHDAESLRLLGRRIYEVIDPDRADEEEGKRLDEEERRAASNASFSTAPNGDGTTRGRFRLPDLHAAMLTKMLQALVAPRRMGDARIDPDTGKKIPHANLLGQGFMELIEHIPADRLPHAGGTPATIVVTIGIDALRSGIGAASLDTGGRISAAAVRRLACSAGIIPMVLGGESQPLDVGRQARLFKRYQRLAMAHRDKGCRAENCDRPPAWTEAHHPDPWAGGGSTSYDKGELLCPHHHRLAHHIGYQQDRLPNGAIRFTRRQ